MQGLALIEVLSPGVNSFKHIGFCVVFEAERGFLKTSLFSRGKLPDVSIDVRVLGNATGKAVTFDSV